MIFLQLLTMFINRLLGMVSLLTLFIIISCNAQLYVNPACRSSIGVLPG